VPEPLVCKYGHVLKDAGQTKMTPAGTYKAQPKTQCNVAADTGAPGAGEVPDREGMDEDEIETIEYIAEMSLCLRDMSVKLGMPFLAYLLEMVFQEAHCASMRKRFGPPGQSPAHQ